MLVAFIMNEASRGQSATRLGEKFLPEVERVHELPKTPTGRFGGKGFGLLASIALTTNNISGAGMLEFPQMFQRAGLLPSLISLGLVSHTSSHSCRHACLRGV